MNCARSNLLSRNVCSTVGHPDGLTALSRKTETSPSFGTRCVLHWRHFLSSLTLTSKQNSTKSGWLLIFSSHLSQRKYAIVLHLDWKIRNCSRVQRDFLRQCSGQRQDLLIHASPSLSRIWPREHWNISRDILTLSTTRQVFNCLEYNHLFIFTVRMEECTGVFTHRYKNLFIYRVTIIFNWEIILFSWSILTKNHRKNKYLVQAI